MNVKINQTFKYSEVIKHPLREIESGVDNDPDTIHLKISLADFSELKSRSRATSSSVPMPSSHR